MVDYMLKESKDTNSRPVKYTETINVTHPNKES